MRFVNHYYDPANRAVVVVGDFDLKETLDRVAHEHEIRPFQGKQSFKPLQPLQPTHIPKDTLVRHNVDVAQLLLGFNGPARQTPNSEKKLATLELLATILGQGGSSRLQKALVENPDHRLCTEIGAGNYTHKNDNLLYIEAQLKPEQIDAAKAAIRTVIDDIAQNGVSQKELDKAMKLKKRASAGQSEQQRSLMSDLAIQIAQGRLEDSYGNRVANLYSTVTSADIQEVAREFLNPDAQRSSALVPRNYNRTPSAHRKNASKAGLRFAGKLSPKDQSRTLPGGTEVVVREKLGHANTAISILLKGGRRLDAIPGEMTLLADMLQRGTQNQTAVELSERLDEAGISFSTEAYDDSVELVLQSLSEDKGKMLTFIDELLSGPAFRPEDLEFIKTKMRDAYQDTVKTDPPVVARDMLMQEVYGGSHPYAYGRDSQTMISGIEGITPERLTQTFQRVFTQPNITISGVGDITLNELADAAQGWMSHLPKESVDAAAPAQKALAKNRIVTKSQEGLKQSEIMRGWHAPNIHEADRVPLLVLNYILSGGMTARLFQTFREGAEKALCYTVNTRYTPRDQGGDFRFYIGTSPENTKLVMNMFQAEVEKLLTEPVSDEELKRAKLQLKSGTLSKAQSTIGVAQYLASHRALNNLSHEELLEAIDHITPAQLQAVAKKVLGKPSTTVVLAPKAALESAQLPVNGSVEA
jgi:predicted Zn-dependent peptidase